MILKTNLVIEEKYTGKSQYEFLHLLQPGDILDIEWDSNNFYKVPQLKITNRSNDIMTLSTLGVWNQVLRKMKCKEL